MIVSFLPEPDKHPLWNEIQELLNKAGEPIDGELVWIAFDRDTLFGAGTTILYESRAHISRCAGFRHKEWVDQAERLVTLWGRDCGVSKITMRGRAGWARGFSALGWAASKADDGKYDYEKDLTGGQQQK